MRYEDALRIAGNKRLLLEKFENVENGGELSKNLLESSLKIKKDLEWFSKIVESKTVVRIKWTDFAARSYLEIFNNFYEFADGCLSFLKKKELYDRIPARSVETKAIWLKKFKKDGYNVDSDSDFEIVKKGVSLYQELVKDVIEITKLIRQYNEFDFVKENKWHLNIPEVEFHFKLMRVKYDGQKGC